MFIIYQLPKVKKKVDIIEGVKNQLKIFLVWEAEYFHRSIKKKISSPPAFLIPCPKVATAQRQITSSPFYPVIHFPKLKHLLWRQTSQISKAKRT